ncbi:Sec23/Sec24 trunk domain-containing protein, partial [Cardiosporidium cionae]
LSMRQQIPQGNVAPVLPPHVAPAMEHYQTPFSTQGSSSDRLPPTTFNPYSSSTPQAAAQPANYSAAPSSSFYIQPSSRPAFESSPRSSFSKTPQPPVSPFSPPYVNRQDTPSRSYTFGASVGPPRCELVPRSQPAFSSYVPAPQVNAGQMPQGYPFYNIEQRPPRASPDTALYPYQKDGRNSSQKPAIPPPLATVRAPVSHLPALADGSSYRTQNLPHTTSGRGAPLKEKIEHLPPQNTFSALPVDHQMEKNYNKAWNKLDMRSFPSNPVNAHQIPTGSSRIDPAHIPRPIFKGPEEALTQIGGKQLSTDRYIAPPSSLSAFTIIDKGSSSCRFMRMTLGQIPALLETLNASCLPLGLIAQPFADLGPEEAPFPQIDLTHTGVDNLSAEDGDGGPIRCLRCRAYINPFMQWESGQTVCVCNFCHYNFKVPSYYLDLLERTYTSFPKDPRNARHELSYGSVDFVAPEEFSETIGQPPRFCFIIESTYAARSTNLTNCALTAIQQVISLSPDPATEITIITFDETVQFYQMDTNKDPALSKLLIVSDIDEPFSPAPESLLCINIEKHRDALKELLQSIPSYFKDVSPSHSAGNAALMAAVDLLSKRGGGVIVMLIASMPDVGIGAYSHIKEEGKSFDELQQVPFYKEIMKKCQKQAISVDYMCFPIRNSAMNLYSMGWISRQTGGKVIYTRNFNWNRDYDKFYYDIHRSLFRPSGFDVTLKLRCSKGISVSKLYSSFQGSEILYSYSSFKIPRLDGDTALFFDLKLEEALTDIKHAFFQCACLYTHFSGKRYIRVQTLALPIASSLSTIFRYADIDSVVSLVLRRAATDVLKGKSSWKETLITAVVDILFAYRYNCTNTVSVGQLFLPDSLKLLPIYVSAILKHAALRDACSRDERIWYLFYFLTIPPMNALILLYPRVFPIHRSFSRRKAEITNSSLVGKPTEISTLLYFPETIPSKGDCLTTDGVYLLDCGNLVLLYIGADVSSTYLSELLESTSSVDPTSSSYILKTQPENCAGAIVHQMIQQIRLERKSLGFPQFKLVFANSLDEEIVYSALIEDNIGAMPTYVEFLSQLHRNVITKIRET